MLLFQGEMYMQTEKKNRVLTIGMAVLLFMLSACCWLKKADAYSASERRALAQCPRLTADAVWSGSFMDAFEDYAADQFPFRDRFRSGKAAAVTGLFAQKDYNGLYMEDGYICRMEYPLKEAMLKNTADHISRLYERYMKDTDVSVYISVIPDKNYFLARKHGALSMDYDALTGILCSSVMETVEDCEYIDLLPLLSIDDYYRTDAHWRQERLTDVATALAEAMGTEVYADYEVMKLEQPFYGVYYGQLALPAKPDRICYLTSSALRNCTVTGYGTGKAKPLELYDLKKAEGRDAYELFLSGSQPFIIIERADADTQKELVLFRDSFGSSLAPLLVEGYKKITVVDTRYLSPELLGDLLTFGDQDVLFLYSTTLVNNSLSLR